MDTLNVVITGASGSGKTTLVEGLRRHPLAVERRLSVARRLVTRPRRQGESDAESDFVTQSQLRWMAGEGLAPFVWPRKMTDRTEWYGFRRPEETEVVVFPANDAILDHINQFERHIGGVTALVVTTCGQDERERRLQDRSPELWSDLPQIEHRLAPAELPSLELRPLVLPPLRPDVSTAIVATMIGGLLLDASLPREATEDLRETIECAGQNRCRGAGRLRWRADF